MTIQPGDSIVVKQEKSTLKPPWDMKPYKVDNVSGTNLYLSRDGRTETISIDKYKLLKFKTPDVKLVLPSLDTVLTRDKITEKMDYWEPDSNCILAATRQNMEQVVVKNMLVQNLDDLLQENAARDFLP